jgi:hypothetical protein
MLTYLEPVLEPKYWVIVLDGYESVKNEATPVTDHGGPKRFETWGSHIL